jgi:hypothetical protein
MVLEEDYTIYGLQVALTFIAISATYFVKISRPETFLALIPVTVLLGYTAFISREKFRAQTAISLLSLIFIPLGGITAVVAVALPILNFLTSIFSSGDSFKDFYGATSLPLLLSGLILGSVLFGLTLSDPVVADRVRSEASSLTGEQAELIVNRSNMLESQTSGQSRLINVTSDTTFQVTRQSVLVNTGCVPVNGSERCTELANAFEQARNSVDEQKKRSTEKLSGRSIDISGRVSDLIENSLEGRNFIILVPAVTFGLYGIHPVIGILTAIWASMFSGINSRVKD